jgi:hypothetical protein
VCGRATENTIIGLIIPEPATRIVTTFDICRFQGVTALAFVLFEDTRRTLVYSYE